MLWNLHGGRFLLRKTISFCAFQINMSTMQAYAENGNNKWLAWTQQSLVFFYKVFKVYDSSKKKDVEICISTKDQFIMKENVAIYFKKVEWKLPVYLHRVCSQYLIQEWQHRITISSRIFLTLKCSGLDWDIEQLMDSRHNPEECIIEVIDSREVLFLFKESRDKFLMCKKSVYKSIQCE